MQRNRKAKARRRKLTGNKKDRETEQGINRVRREEGHSKGDRVVRREGKEYRKRR